MAATVSRVTPPEASRGIRRPTSGHGLAQLGEGHVVEQDAVGASGQRGRAPGRGCRIRPRPAARRHGRRAMASAMSGGEQQVVVLDEHRVVQSHPVVGAAAAADGPLLGRTQARGRLAGVEDDRARARHGVHVATGQGRDARQSPQQVERQPLPGEDRPGPAPRSCRRRPGVTRSPSAATAATTLTARVQRRVHLPDEREAAHDAGLLEQQVGTTRRVGGTVASVVRSPSPTSSASHARMSRDRSGAATGASEPLASVTATSPGSGAASPR